MIPFACPGCGRTFKVKEEFAGRKTSCPACKTRIQVPQAVADMDDGAPKPKTWSAGDRVLAHWRHDVSWWYPARITRCEGVLVYVQFDDGDSTVVVDDQVMAFDIAVGTAVSARFQNGQVFFPGTITSINGDKCHVAYDDGDQEWTVVGCLRVDRGRPESAGPTPAMAPASRPANAGSGATSILSAIDGILNIATAAMGVGDAMMIWPSHCPDCRMKLETGATVCPYCRKKIL